LKLRDLVPDESAETTPARLRQGLLLRAALATGVMGMLAAGLVLLDAQGGEVAAVTPAPATAGSDTTPAAETRSAVVPGATAPGAAASPDSVPTSAAPQSGATASPALPSAGGEASSPPPAAPAATPAAADIAGAPAPVGTPADTTPARAAAPVTELPATSAQAPDAAATPTTKEPSAHPGSPPPGPGFMVQLGVFTDSANAESLRRELARKGYPAHLQSRVVLGPFPNRQTALAAQEKVRRERKLDGMILPPRKP